MLKRALFVVILLLALAPATTEVGADRSDTCSAATLLTPGTELGGTINPERDEDRFKFPLQQGDTLWLRLHLSAVPEDVRMESDPAGVRLVPVRNATPVEPGEVRIDRGVREAILRAEWVEDGWRCFALTDGGGPNTLYPYEYTLETRLNEPFDLPEASRGTLTFDDQVARDDGTLVTVQSVSMNKDGFVAVRTTDGDIVGVSRHLESGNYSNVDIRLDAGRGLAEGERVALTAVLHRDTNDDRVFNYPANSNLDGPFEVDGSLVTDSASVEHQVTPTTTTATTTSTVTTTPTTTTTTTSTVTTTPTTTVTPTTTRPTTVPRTPTTTVPTTSPGGFSISPGVVVFLGLVAAGILVINRM